MSLKKSIKKYWRIYLLVILVLLSIAVIFSPVVPGLDIGDGQDVEDDASWDEKYTSLQYSIELAGGTRIRAPLIGVTAENANIGTQDIDELEESIATDFEKASARDVRITTPDESDSQNKTIEVTSRDVTQEAMQSSLERNDITYESMRDGVTEETRDEAITVLQNKIDQAGLSGGSVRSVQLSDGTEFILVEVPNIDREGTIQLIEERGEVNIDIYYRDSETNEYTNRTTLTTDDFRNVGSAQQGSDTQSPHVPVTIEAGAAQQFQSDVVETGVASSGGSTCRYETDPENTEPCLLTVVDGEVVYSAGMAASLASSMQSGTWADDPSFILQTSDYGTAQNLAINLRAGVMPAQLDIGAGEVSFVSAQQGDEFRMIAFIIGVLSTLAVATSVSLRYGKPKIAAPMLITAFAEVIILLAVASALRYPIDIAVIAGFVAVIGTGIDDLIIIADQVMGGENPATSRKIFDKRFKKAFKIIMGAAITTILALGPIAVLELNELQGFAIFTIIGIIIGVTITRPAYGDILRILYTDEK